MSVDWTAVALLALVLLGGGGLALGFLALGSPDLAATFAALAVGLASGMMSPRVTPIKRNPE